MEKIRSELEVEKKSKTEAYRCYRTDGSCVGEGVPNSIILFAHDFYSPELVPIALNICSSLPEIG